MAYIIKNTSGLINTRITDVGRRNISQGNFNISYFQIGDSEVSYNSAANYNQTNNNILMPAFNAQNDTGSPQSNKQNIKYPYYLQGSQGNTYGIPYMDSGISEVYNSAGVKGFFEAGGSQGNWQAQTSSAYTITSNYWVDLSTLDGTDQIVIEYDFCSPTTGTPAVNDFITLFIDSNGGCGDFSTINIFTYKIQAISPSPGTINEPSYTITLDRSAPNMPGFTGNGRALVYPAKMTDLYDTITPQAYWNIDTINYESPCDVSSRENTPIWNMNIPWSVNPAGLFSNVWEGYNQFGSVSYLGTKEYLGYQEPSGQTDTSQVYYYNSFDEKIVVPPSEQKAIAIIHYTNQDIDNVYGEKFSTVPFDPQNPTDDTGLARHFKLTMPTLMWHKSSGSSIGETFYIDPPNFDLCKPFYIRSRRNTDMNDPGIRYYHLWDTNVDANNQLNRIGKVFPDQEIIIIDDQEVVAALSNKSNRNWTLPTPKLSLLTPNTCFPNNNTATGIMSGANQTMWVTYRMDNTGYTESLHCNNYAKIVGPTNTTTSQDIAVRFGPEFPFLNDDWGPANFTGFSANSIKLICQLTTTGTQPSPTLWKEIDITSELTATMVNGYLNMSGLTGTTFQISLADYNSAPTYNLSNYLDLTPLNSTNTLNFGDEFYFYGNIETDISATIYEMRYLINLNRNQFTNTSNPTWTPGTTSYVTEIGLFDSNKDLVVISKLQSPEVRQGVQQYSVKIDF
jgi:hypothetical protein